MDVNVDGQIEPTLLTALENERRFTANALHDGVAQTTLQLGLQAGICRKLMEHNQLDLLATELAQLEARVQLASSQVKALIQDLRPPIIDTDTPDLQSFIEYAIQVHHQRGGPPVTFLNLLEMDASLTQLQMLGLMRIVQERLQLVRKYAQASLVQIILQVESDVLYLRITDDGKTPDPGMMNGRTGAENGVRAGIVNLKTRTSAVGGTLDIGLGPDGNGTAVTIRVPL